MALYIILTHKQEEIDKAGLSNVIHKRKHEAGPRPGITTSRAFALPPENEEDKWKQPERVPTEDEKKTTLAMAIITAAGAVMTNHCYTFNNTWRQQEDGGAIGNLLIGEIAKLVMAWWTTQFNELARTAAQDPILVEESDSQYVDDYNFVFHILPPGMRWRDDETKMEIEQNLIEQDMTMADDVRSMKEIIKMANSICPILQFTGDCPGANTNNKLPILHHELLG